jgi:hypothetical protein
LGWWHSQSMEKYYISSNRPQMNLKSPQSLSIWPNCVSTRSGLFILKIATQILLKLTSTVAPGPQTPPHYDPMNIIHSCSKPPTRKLTYPYFIHIIVHHPWVMNQLSHPTMWGHFFWNYSDHQPWPWWKIHDIQASPPSSRTTFCTSRDTSWTLTKNDDWSWKEDRWSSTVISVITVVISYGHGNQL